MSAIGCSNFKLRHYQNSPHGDFGGAYLLNDFRRWRAKHQKDDAWNFLTQRFKQPGLFGRFNEFRATDPANYVERDGPIAEMHDKDIVALAFALLKIDGVCDPNLGKEALQALVRRQNVTVAARLGWTMTPHDQEIAARLEAKLRSCL